MKLPDRPARGQVRKIVRKAPTLARSANENPPIPLYPGDPLYPKGIKLPVVERKERS